VPFNLRKDSHELSIINYKNGARQWSGSLYPKKTKHKKKGEEEDKLERLDQPMLRKQSSIL
jgi:hypothetical protein